MVLEGAIEFWIFDIGLIISLNVSYQYVFYLKKINLNVWVAMVISFSLGILSFFITYFIRDAT
jgi:hypothetical protein